MLSSHRFLCLPLRLPPCTVPCRIVLASPDDPATCPYHFSLPLFTEVRTSYGPMAFPVLAFTSSLVMWSLYGYWEVCGNGKEFKMTQKTLLWCHSQNSLIMPTQDSLWGDSGTEQNLISISGPELLSRYCVGLAVLPDAASRVRTSSEPPVEGTFFHLELTWFLTPFPQNSSGWEYKPRSSLCTRAFHCTNSKDPDMHVLDGWLSATKTHPACTIHEDGMWLPPWVE